MSGKKATGVNTNTKAFKEAVAKAVKDATPGILDYYEQLKAKDTQKETAENSQEVAENLEEDSSAPPPSKRQKQDRVLVQENVEKHLRELRKQGEKDPQVSEKAIDIISDCVVVKDFEVAGAANSLESLERHVDEGVRLDLDVTEKMEKDILSHKYIDFELLTKPSEKDTKTANKMLEIKHHEKSGWFFEEKDQSVENQYDINKWITQFSIYSAVMCKKQPQYAYGLFTYLDTIRSLHAAGDDWVYYDRRFRKLHASNMKMYPFHKQAFSVMLQAQSSREKTGIDRRKADRFKSERYDKYDRYDKGERNDRYGRNDRYDRRPSYTQSSRNSYQPDNYTPEGTPKYKKGYCWTYQRGEHCTGCNYPSSAHVCCWCRGKHPADSCPQPRAESEGRSRRQSSSEVSAQSSQSAPRRGANTSRE